MQIVNINNGERLETYVIERARNSGEITLNSPAARKVQKEDVIIVISYCTLPIEETKQLQPKLVFPNETTNLLS